jgi:GNAT superfamily N-acetyltransferase
MPRYTGGVIRRARVGDEEALLALAADFATSFRVEATAFGEAFAELITSPATYLAVAEVNGEVVGYALAFEHPTFYANGRVAWVEEIAVRDDHRRMGVGRMLMQSAEAWATERACRLIALATRRAAEFYRALGYEESATYFRKML